ncbi:hypothetical protein O6H91_02G126800 [Diphasiastrum complanatum]|uniref:Uncharacterized protein n=1 Tax=Diphasiastrum complanatum TaxID=34168 RepID=A0ACC2EKF5_DIPCM|nr:hypothetical protein O6H91_02G126800 [Diphasiastrum complanatum]
MISNLPSWERTLNRDVIKIETLATTGCLKSVADKDDYNPKQDYLCPIKVISSGCQVTMDYEDTYRDNVIDFMWMPHKSMKVPFEEKIIFLCEIIALVLWAEWAKKMVPGQIHCLHQAAIGFSTPSMLQCKNLSHISMSGIHST